jgi:hypothetical protein
VASRGLSIEVRTRIGGAGPRAASLAPVRVDVVESSLTLAQLIRRTVEEQVRELQARQKLDAAAVQEALDRQYLTDAEMAAQVEQHAAIRMPARAHGRIDAQHEVQRALMAFERGVYHVLVDGRQIEHLNDRVDVRLGTRVTFLRLMPLAGGASERG